MAKDHSHPEPKRCAHDLGWCEKCERPYCKSCGLEWVAQTVSIPSMWTTLQNSPKTDFTTTKPMPMPQWLRPNVTGMPHHRPPTVYCGDHVFGQGVQTNQAIQKG